MIDRNSPTVLIRVWMLGAFQVERRNEDGTWETVDRAKWEKSYARLLFKRLLCSSGRRAQRNTLIDDLWPDPGSPELVERYLNDAAYHLRKVLRAADLLKTFGNASGYKLADQSLIWMDVDEFETLMREAEKIGRKSAAALRLLEQAKEYIDRGELLESEGGLWCHARRGTFERMRYLCHIWLAEAYEQQEMVGQAEMQYSRLLEDDPIDEDVLCRLIAFFHRQGMTQQAQRCYEEAKQRFKQDGLQLSSATDAFIESLLNKPRQIEFYFAQETFKPLSFEHNQRQIALPSLPFARQEPEISSDRTKSVERPVAWLSTQAAQQQEILSLVSHAITHGIEEAIHELERALLLNTSDSVTRRTLLARLLSIPPALSELDGRFINGLTEAILFLEKDTLDLYEDMLVIGWDGFRRSKSPEIINRIDGYVNKLTTLSREIPEGKREHWQSLLCRFSQLSTRIAQHSMNAQRALSMARQAIEVAIELDDAELIVSAFYRRSRVHLEYSNTETDEGRRQKHFVLAKADVDAALAYAKQVRTPLKGNIYLIAAEIYALLAGNDASLRTQCEAWQDKVAALVYGGDIEDDGTFLKLDPTALHHEKAKTLIHFGRLQEARHELDMARKTLPPNLLTWHMNMHLTETSLSLAERDVERSSTSGIQAYTIAKAIHSHKGKAELKHLFAELQRLDPINSYTCDLGMVVEGKS